MSVGIVTGYTGSPHVTAMDDKIRNAAGLSKNEYVFNIGEALMGEKIADDEVRIHSGSGIMQGVQFSIQPTDYEDVSISAGQGGYERWDLICARYEKNDTTGIESVTIVVHEGDFGAYDAAVKPYGDVVTGDLLDGDLVNEMVLFEVKMHDVRLATVEMVADVVDVDTIDSTVIDTIWNEIWTED